MIHRVIRDHGCEPQLGERRTAAARAQWMKPHKSPSIAVMTLFGVLMLVSPRLRDVRTKRSARPLAELGLRHGARTPALERALTDFGAEESFGQAAKRFHEHWYSRPELRSAFCAE